MKPKIVFFGAGNYIVPIVEMLKKYQLCYVITTEKDGKLINYLKQQNIPFISSCLKTKENAEKIISLKPDIGVLASYGAIIPKKIIDLFPLEILNIHPSLLPKYKGPSPIQAAILNGDKQTGVTIIKLDAQIDHGPIVFQKVIELKGNETMQELKTKLFGISAEMIDQILEDIEKGKPLISRTQEESNEKTTSKVTRQSGFIDINNLPNFQTIQRMIRAYYPWPGVWTEYELYGKKRRIKLLPENKIQVEGKRVMNLREFENGYQKEAVELLSKLGLCL